MKLDRHPPRCGGRDRRTRGCGANVGPGLVLGKAVGNVAIVGGTLAVLAGLGRMVYMVATGSAIKARDQAQAVDPGPPADPGELRVGPIRACTSFGERSPSAG